MIPKNPHQRAFLAATGHPGERFSSWFSEWKNEPGPGGLTVPVRAVPQTTQDVPLFELGDGPLARTAELGVVGVGVLFHRGVPGPVQRLRPAERARTAGAGSMCGDRMCS